MWYVHDVLLSAIILYSTWYCHSSVILAQITQHWWRFYPAVDSLMFDVARMLIAGSSDTESACITVRAGMHTITTLS
jgi:hypothetical protein